MRTLLYFGPSGIGDWCFIWPSIPDLLKQQNCDRLHLIIPYENAGNRLLASHPQIQQITYLQRDASWSGIIGYAFRWLALLRSVRKQHYRSVVVSYLSNQADNLLLCALSGIPQRIGRDYPASFLSARAFTRTIHSGSAQGRVKVHLDYLQQPSTRAGDQANLFDSLPRTKLNPDLLTRLEQPYIVLASGGGRGAQWRFWKPEHYRELIRLNPQISFVLLGNGNDDQQQADAIRAVAPPPNLIDLTDQTDMPTALEILHGASAVVGNDTGIPNISATLGIPTLVLYGPTNPAITGATLLGAAEAHISVPCGPCFDDSQNLATALACSHRRCLAELPPEQVNHALHALMKQAATRK